MKIECEIKHLELWQLEDLSPLDAKIACVLNAF